MHRRHHEGELVDNGGAVRISACVGACVKSIFFCVNTLKVMANIIQSIA